MKLRFADLELLKQVVVGDMNVRWGHLELLRSGRRKKGDEGVQLLQELTPDFVLAARIIKAQVSWYGVKPSCQESSDEERDTKADWLSNCTTSRYSALRTKPN